MMHILRCNASQRHRSCDTYPRISPEAVAVAQVFAWSGVLRFGLRAGRDDPGRLRLPACVLVPFAVPLL